MTSRWFVMLLFCGLAGTSFAEEPKESAAEKPVNDSEVHDELRALREALTKAVAEGDVESQLAYAHEDIVVTWQNSQVVRGRDGLKTFMSEMNAGQDRVFQGYTVPPTSDDLTIIHQGNTGIAFGRSVPHYRYLGMEFDLENRWTATLVREDDGWKIAAYHVSANLFDNPVLDVSKRSIYWTGGIALAVGIIVGIIGSCCIKKCRRPATPQ
ncbi:MAG: YybH family protein [Planctomycetaceae bacterium]